MAINPTISNSGDPTKNRHYGASKYRIFLWQSAILFLASLTPISAFAGGDGSQTSLFLLLLLLLAILLVPPLILSLLVWLILAIRNKTNKANTASEHQTRKKAMLLWVTFSFALALLLWGAALYVHNQKKKIDEKQAQDRSEALQTAQGQQKEMRWRESPLGIAACRPDLDTLKDIVDSQTQIIDVEIKLTVAKKCAIEPARADVLRVLIKDQIYNDTDKFEAWSEVSQATLNSFNHELASVILAADKPAFRVQQHQLYLAALLKNHEASPAQKIAWLKHLQKNGMPIEMVDAQGHSLLRVAFETQDADIINFALDLGMDPNVKSIHSTVVSIRNTNTTDKDTQRETTERYTWSPLQSWTLRRFGYVWSEHSKQGIKVPTLTDAAIHSIQQGLRELTPEEASLRHPNYQLRTDMPDGGAALFKYMHSRGVQLDIADASGKGLLSAQMRYSDQLFRALDELRDDELQKLTCPRSANGPIVSSLADQARQYQNQTLIKLFAHHQLKRCTFVH